MPAYARVIVNPVSGSGLTGLRWHGMHKALTDSGLQFNWVRTEARGHAIELAKEAALSGYGMIIAAGGDGTLNEVVNGIILSGAASETSLGILNTGTGCDFARFLGIPRDYRRASERLARCRTVKVDVGVVDHQLEGRTATRYFISAAGLGFDGKVVETAAKGPGFVRGAIPYFWGVLHSLSVYRNKDVRLRLDDSTEDIRILSVIVANGGSYAAGMRIAPGASLQDGLFEVMIVGDVSKLELLQALPRIYRGTHIGHPKIRIEKASVVAIDCPEEILIQADGELVGEGPAQFRVLPLALNLVL